MNVNFSPSFTFHMVNPCTEPSLLCNTPGCGCLCLLCKPHWSLLKCYLRFFLALYHSIKCVILSSYKVRNVSLRVYISQNCISFSLYIINPTLLIDCQFTVLHFCPLMTIFHSFRYKAII